MRLICPNCGAEYEVPDEVIPPEGRDVQCSNCGHTWYQAHPDHPEAAVAPAEPAEPAADPTGGADTGTDTGTDTGAPQPAPRRDIDPQVAGILREEAEREARLRARERQPLESQPDLGLQPGESLAERRRREARERMARLRGEDPAAAAGDDGAQPGSRRELLPDIEEINSSLRPGSGATPGTEIGPLLREEAFPPQEPERSGFLRGFAVAVAVAVVLGVAYAKAQAISAAVPALEPALSAYAGMIDQARVWLEDQAMSLLPKVEP